MPLAARRVDTFLDPLNEALIEFDIGTPTRIAHFMAQVAHESAQFRYMRELANGSAYEGRHDLGNDEPGDGPKFLGRGPIQTTGRKNYRLVSIAIYGDERLLDTPELLERPLDGCRAAGYFWRTGAGLNLSKRAIEHGVPVGCNLNNLADADDFMGITLAVNGGTNGIDDRQKYLEAAKAALA